MHLAYQDRHDVDGTSPSGERPTAVLDDHGRFVATNEAWRELGVGHGQGTTSELGSNYLDLCESAGEGSWEQRGAQGIRALLAGGHEPVSFDHALDVRRFSFTATLLVEGESVLIVVTHHDVTTRRREEAEGAAARSLLRAVGGSMAEGFVTLGPGGIVRLMNRAAEAMLGWTVDEIRGQRLHDVTRHRGADGFAHAMGRCAVGDASADAAVLRVDDEVFMRRNGLALPVSYSVTQLEILDGVDGCVVVFTDATDRRAREDRARKDLIAVDWIERVEAALDDDRFKLYAQPIVDLATMAVTQQEILLRVEEKDGSVSAPGEYLAIAEEFGLIGDIDRWVIRRSIELAAQGHAVEVNVSAESVSDPLMIDDIAQWLAESAADPARLVFEITETAMISNEQAGRRFVDQIHRLGCKVALDDFGTGYCGFAYLKQLPVDYLKIDIEFVRDLTSNSASRHVVEAVVNLARGFGLTTVAEGVEDADTLELLIALGVDQAQGFHLGRPAPWPAIAHVNDAEVTA